MEYRTRYQICHKLMPKICNMNDCKVLRYDHSAGRYYLSIRDRQKDQTYYTIIIRGNYIKAYSERYEDDNGQGINAYVGLFLPALISGERPEVLPKYKVKLILKTPLAEHKRFLEQFIELTPNLDWHLGRGLRLSSLWDYCERR